MRSKQFDPAVIWPVLLTDIASGASLTAALERVKPSPYVATQCFERDIKRPVKIAQTA
jgi:hypothetical protein